MTEAAFDPMVLPPNLPVPEDDGAADHLSGSTVPDVALPTTDGRLVSLGGIRGTRLVVYAYPHTVGRGKRRWSMNGI